MKKLRYACVSMVAAAGCAAPMVALAATTTSAATANVLDVFVDTPTGFTFVKLPGGWKFVGAISEADMQNLPPGVLNSRAGIDARRMAPDKLRQN